MTNPNAQFYTEWDDQNLSPQENAFAHNLAIDFAEQLSMDNSIANLSEQQLIDTIKRSPEYDKLISEHISEVFGENWKEQSYKVAQLVQEAIKKAMRIQTLKHEEETLSVKKAEIERLKALGVERFVRVMPKSYLNPNVSQNLKDGNLTQAARGFWNKIDRAVRLFSGDGYTLKTKEQASDRTKGDVFTEKVSRTQSEIGYNVRGKMLLGEQIKILEEQILPKVKEQIKGKSKEIEELNQKFKNVKAKVSEADVFMDDLSYSLRIEQFEQDQNSGTWLDRAAGRVIAGPALALFARKDSEKYAKAYDLQKDAEDEIIALERKMVKALEDDLPDYSIAENRNALGVFNPNSVTYAEFQERQNHLEIRLAALRELVESNIYKTKWQQEALRADLDAHKGQRKDNVDNLGEIKKFEKRWLKVGGAEMERLFWHQFGNQVVTIRSWQGELPKVNRGGRQAYVGQITRIFTEYVTLREEVKNFEQQYKITGMQAILDRELGTMKYNGALANTSKLQEVERDLYAVQQELEIRKKRAVSADNKDENKQADQVAKQTSQDNKAIDSTPQAPVSAQGAISPHTTSPTQVNIDANTQARPEVVGALPPQPAPAQQVSIDQTAQAAQVAVQGALAPNLQPNTWGQLDLDFSKPNIEVTGAVSPEVKSPAAVEIDKNAPEQKQIVAQTAEQTIERETERPADEMITAEQLAELDKSLELVRPAETMIIGDLNGSLALLKDALECHKAVQIEANGDWKWTAGNRKLVLVGDILADRTAEGLKILDKIIDLRKQAEAVGGKITIIFGNHEDIAVSFLTERKVAGQSEEKDSLNSLGNAALPKPRGQEIVFDWQGLGILELIANYTSYGKQFNGDLVALRAKIESEFKQGNYQVLSQLPAEARVAMQTSESGRKYIDEICQMKLAELDGDTLIIHTEPTAGILAELTNGISLAANINRINADFQQGLTALLTGSGKMPEVGQYALLLSTFSHPDNRFFSTRMGSKENQENLEKLSKLGAKRIVHGHSALSADHNHVYDAQKIQIVNVDFGTGKEGFTPGTQQVGMLGQKGEIAVGKEQVEQVAAFDQNKQAAIKEVGEWLNIAFPLLENEHDAWAIQLAETLHFNNEAEVKAKLSPELAEFFFKTWDALSSKSAKPTLATIGRMINFYKEWVAIDKRDLATKIAEISAMGLPFGQETINAWREKYGQKPQSTAEVVTQTAQATAKTLAETDSDQKEQAAATESTPTELKAVTAEDIQTLSKDELEKRALEMIQPVFGPKNVISMILEKAKISSPKRHAAYLSSILLYPEVLALLFTLRYKGKKMTKDGKVKTIDPSVKLNDLENSNTAKVLGRTEVLEKIGKFLEGKTETELTQILSGHKSTLGWFNSFVKK